MSLNEAKMVSLKEQIIAETKVETPVLVETKVSKKKK